MNATSPKPTAEVLSALDGHNTVMVVVCTGCPIGMGTVDDEMLDKAVGQLRAQARKVLGPVKIDMVCNKALVGVRLGRRAADVRAADALLVYSCGVGVQSVGNMAAKPVVPGLNTICVGGMQGLWPSDERCGQCGDCMLAETGGICPITTCSKSLVNGACGGTKNGKCEVSQNKDCGWYLIYQRLKDLGRLDRLLRMQKPRDHSLQDIPDAQRRRTLWALEVDEAKARQEEALAAAAAAKKAAKPKKKAKA
jgi:hypothetical protein